ncbi:CRISPR-associated endonuclease Cas2 [Campylobacter sp. 2018MI13]|uniref:CRISPR-associated endonuclease Cas2 n=1 Tax=Campylobacter sp. 2018MI13 TaxID=2836737 RepID=UPI002023E88B|nr:CRISPR-associated endonuclease Cas2 [Campylobacter sp. 2018MI13]
MLYIVCYDINSNKTRKIIHDTLLSCGERINLSVFELNISCDRLNKLIKYFKSLINPKTDIIKIYPVKMQIPSHTIGKIVDNFNII